MEKRVHNDMETWFTWVDPIVIVQVPIRNP